MVLKLKSSDFKLRTRNMRLTYPSLREDVILEAALTLLKKEIDGTKYRLLGVGVTDLFAADQADPVDLFADTASENDLTDDDANPGTPAPRAPIELPRPTAEQLRESLTRRYRQHKKKIVRQQRFRF